MESPTIKPSQISDYYRRLGIPRTAKEQEIKQAYRRLSKTYHPDVNQYGLNDFLAIKEAYETIKNNVPEPSFNVEDLVELLRLEYEAKNPSFLGKIKLELKIKKYRRMYKKNY